MTIKKSEKRSRGSFFRIGLQLMLFIFLFGAISCSKEDPVTESQSQGLLAKKKKPPVPYDKFSKALKKAKLQGPGSGIIKKKIRKNNKDVWVNVEKENFAGYKSSKFYLKDNRMYFVSPKGSKKRTELRRFGDYAASTNLKATGNLKVHSKDHKEFTVMQLHHSGKNSPVLKIEYKAKSGNNKAGFYAVNREKPKASTSGRTQLLKASNSGKFEIIYEPYTKNLGKGKKEARSKVKIKVDGKTFKIKIGKDKSGKNKYTDAIVDLKQSDWGTGFYFKAGAYNQQSGEAKVSFSSLNW